jgi:predicted Na+-dependent transporter
MVKNLFIDEKLEKKASPKNRKDKVKVLKIYIDGMEFIFLLMGYSLALIEYKNNYGYWMLGLMIIVMVFSFFYRQQIIFKVKRN